MIVELKQLRIRNFKGVKDLTVDFSGETTIGGGNGIGKTSVFDSLIWLLFGKDSQLNTEKDFAVKPREEDGSEKHNIEVDVFGILNIDGEDIHINRILREKWVTKRGTAKPVYEGNETIYFWNEVPLKQSEFKQKIGEILDESAFMLVTNTSYFSRLHWKERRDILINMIGGFSDAQVIDSMATLSNKDEVLFLTNILNSKESFEDSKKRIAAKRKKLNDELKLIPTRIDEAHRGMPEERDFDQLESEIKILEASIQKIDDAISDKSKGLDELVNARSEKLREVSTLGHQLKDRMTQIEEEANLEKKKLDKNLEQTKRDLFSINSEITTAEKEIKFKQQQLENKIKEQDELRQKWDELNSSELKINEDEFICPTCKRAFETDDIEAKKSQMLADFNTSKHQKLSKWNEEGVSMNSIIESIRQEITFLNDGLTDKMNKRDEINTSVNRLKEQVSEYSIPDIDELTRSDAKCIEIRSKIDSINSSLPQIQPQDNSELTAKKEALKAELIPLKQSLSKKEVIVDARKRIDELKQREKVLAQEVADLEQQEFSIDRFTKVKIDHLEKKINEKFNLVTFKMFNQQINGGESETCDILVDGVPFGSVNTASRINAGLDIINTLSEYYGICAPVFIDQRESVNTLIKSESQIINLIVTDDKSLNVSYGNPISESRQAVPA